MTKKTNWLELVKKNEDKIREALEKVYSDACVSGVGNFRCIESAILDYDEKISFTYETENETDGAVWRGEAIYLGSCKQFLPWENENEWEFFIKPLLSDDQKEKFLKFLDDEIPCFNQLEQFNEELYNKIVSECIEDYTLETITEWADEKFNSLIEDLEQRELMDY